MKSKNKEYELFDSLSEEWWDEEGKFKVLHDIKPLRMQYILDQLKDRKISDLEILDIGCGGGLICEPLCRLGGKVTGIDFVKNNINVATAHSKLKKLKINYYCQDIENLKINKKYDLIIIFEVLEHLDDWKLFITKITKNLKLNGKIIISTINRNYLSKYTAIFLAENILKWIPKNTHDYKKFIKPDEIKNFAGKNNLFLKDLKGLVFNPIEFSWKMSKISPINYFCTLSKN